MRSCPLNYFAHRFVPVTLRCLDAMEDPLRTAAAGGFINLAQTSPGYPQISTFVYYVSSFRIDPNAKAGGEAGTGCFWQRASRLRYSHA